MSPKNNKRGESYNQLEAGTKRAKPVQHQRGAEI